MSNPAGSAWQEWGLLPRAAIIFSRASAVGGVEGLLGPGSRVSCSFLEVRDDGVDDLLGKGRRLQIRESASRGVHVPGATMRLVEWEEDVMRALVIGLQRRGESESTSHLIFTLTLSQRLADGSTKECSLQAVYLGSAESIKPGTSRQSSQPPANANKSLAALDRCIDALAEGLPHDTKPPSLGEPNPQGIPYRDSKLTWLLRDALGGAAGQVPIHTVFVGVCSPEAQQLPSTINTLRFAHRCRQARMWVAKDDVLLLPGPQQPQLTLEDANDLSSGVGGRSPDAHKPTTAPAQPLSSPELVPSDMTGTMSAMKLGPEPDSESSEEEDFDKGGGEDADGGVLRGSVSAGGGGVVAPTGSPPPTMSFSLSDRTRETTDLRHRLASLEEKVRNVAGSDSRAADAAQPGPSKLDDANGDDGWEQLQSAHAHILLLEARLAELSQENADAA